MSIKNFNSTLKMEKEPQLSIPLPPPLPPSKVGKGIVSILGSDSEKSNKAAASIRRALSADMSSKKWLSQNGLSQNGLISPMKKIASSKELAVLGQDDVWTSIQNSNNKEPTSNDVWSSILTQKKEESSTLPPPYVHPLLKKSSSSLTEKSLEICTESLGSETGSELSLSSYPPSDTDEDKDEHHQKQQQQEKEEVIISQSFEEFPVVKYNHNKKTSSSRKSFPPPISSLASEDNPSVQMQSHRQNGRLILEAVSIPQNHLRAKRVDGHLVLTLITTKVEPEIDDLEEVFEEIQEVEQNEQPALVYDDDDDDDQEEEVEEKGNGTKGVQIVLEQKPRLSNGRMNVNTSTLMMKQLMGLEKNNHHLTWSNKFNKAINLIDGEDEIAPIQQISAAASFNAYDYFWKKNPTVTTIVNNYNDNSTAATANGTTKIASNYEQQDLVLMRGNKGNINYLMPLLKGCKEQRRSLLIWEPYCIATSY